MVELTLIHSYSAPPKTSTFATTDAYAALPVTQTSQLEPGVGDETGQSQ
ncbi:hypothetical protein GGD62_005699 [Bradyrhizobium sp. ERR14]|nr:hypothetical protein [Bradyrhizobium sp. ERR14]